MSLPPLCQLSSWNGRRTLLSCASPPRVQRASLPRISSAATDTSTCANRSRAQDDGMGLRPGRYGCRICLPSSSHRSGHLGTRLRLPLCVCSSSWSADLIGLHLGLWCGRFWNPPRFLPSGVENHGAKLVFESSSCSDFLWYGLGVVCTGQMHSMWKNNLGGNIFNGNRSRGSHLLSSCSMLVSLNALCFN